ncbi:MAG: terminase, large subunit, partial [Burkholderiales bacterium]|nr:terminase, large subunit [Burkholderiales bacterium]
MTVSQLASVVERLREASPAALAEWLSDGSWVRARHLERLNDRLLDFATGRIRRLLVSMPPRHGKSELISHWLPVWYLNTWPERRIILATYGADFAADWGRRVRNTVQEHADSLRVRIAQDSAASNRWHTTAGGGMVAAGAGGPLTGRGADLFIIDDPIKTAEDAYSATWRERVWDWWTTTARTRLEPGASVVVLMTRWHDDDLAGRILRNAQESGDGWEVLNLPALAEEGDP